MAKLERYIGQLVDDRGGVDTGTMETIVKDLEKSTLVKKAQQQVMNFSNRAQIESSGGKSDALTRSCTFFVLRAFGLGPNLSGTSVDRASTTKCMRTGAAVVQTDRHALQSLQENRILG